MIEELQLGTLIKKCKHLKYNFSGVYAAYNFSSNLENGNFIVVNSDTATRMGTHWFLLCNKNNKYLFADPLGLPFNNYPHVRDRLSFASLRVTETIQAPLQNLISNQCELYCINKAHYEFGPSFPYFLILVNKNKCDL